jgi:hypothetical protein
MVLYHLENMSPCSKLYRIQTTDPPLIAQFLFEACCIPRDLTIPGTLQLYSGSRGHTLDNPQCVSRQSHASRSSFPGPLCSYNEQEHGTSLRSKIMGIGTLMPHLLGVPVWDGGASAPEGADARSPHHLDILPSRRAASEGGRI